MLELLLKSFDEFEIYIPVANKLNNKGFHFLGDVAFRTEEELLAIPGWGQNTVREIKKIMRNQG
jgi:DNA-directed RNA polymerase alpha subunit